MPTALVFTEYGGPQTQHLVDLPKPVPGPDELLVAVRAAGVNPVDWKIREGYLRDVFELSLPKVMGSELSGVIEQVGEGVSDFQVGEGVFGSPVAGAFTEYALLPVRVAARKPDAVSFIDAATLPVAAATAYDALAQLALPAGATVLVLGAGGGVGVATVQLARAAGHEVIAVAGAAKRDFLTSLGAVHVASGPGTAERVRAAAPAGIDALVDLVGGDPLRELAVLVDDRARIVTAVDPGAAAEFGGAALRRQPGAGTLVELARLVETGDLAPRVSEVYPLHRAADALAAVECGHTLGKVVIEVS